MLWVEGNLADGHKTTVRSRLPAVTWRKPNHGVPLSKPRPEQITATCGMLEAYAQVDKNLAELNGNTAEFRLSENMPFLYAMNREMARTVFYGDTTSETEKFKFMELAPHYSSKDAATTETATNVIDGGGAGNDGNTSIWLITWGPVTCHGIFPKGKISGLQLEDLGEVTLSDGDGGLYQGYRSHYKWDAGLCLRDWRYVVRVANIDVSELTTSAFSAANLINAMIRAIHKVPDESMGNMVFCCNATTYTWLDLQTLSRSNNALTYGKDVHGRKIVNFRGIPVRKCAAIADNEAAI